jgi:hypothetical protein
VNREEKIALLDKLSADKDSTSNIIVCQSGDYTRNDTRTMTEECFVCDHQITCFKVSAEKKKDGFMLMCRECFAETLRRSNARDEPVKFDGIIRNNELPAKLRK